VRSVKIGLSNHKDLESLLNELIGHKVAISFTPHEESELRETFGILKAVSKEIIHIELYDDYGEKDSDYYLNRHACTLHSIVDHGKKNKKIGMEHNSHF